MGTIPKPQLRGSVNSKARWSIAALCCVLLAHSPVWGAACPDPAPEVRTLLEADDLDGALQLAREASEASPADLLRRHSLLAMYVLVAFVADAERGTEALGQALSEADAIRARWPEDPTAYVCRVALLRSLPERDAYLDALEQAAARFGESSREDLVAFPATDVATGRYARGKRAASRLLRTYPNDARLLSTRGVARLNTEELDDAAEDFGRALELEPSDPVILRNAATVAIYMQEVDLAISLLERLARTAAGDPQLLYEIATLELARNPLTSVEAWRRYLDKREKSEEPDAWADSAERIVKLLEGEPRIPDLVQLSSEYIAVGEPRYAIPLLGALAARHPREAMYPFMMAAAYDGCGLPLVSHRLLRRAEGVLATAGGSGYGLAPHAVWYERARAALKLGRAEEGLFYLEQTEQSEPETRNLQYMLALAHAQLGHRDDALRYFEECASRENNQEFAKLCQRQLPTPPESGETPGAPELTPSALE